MDMFDFDLQLFAEGEASETTATTNETVAVTAPTEVATTTTTETTNNEPAETHEAAETNDAVYLVTDPRTGRKRIVSEKPQEDEQPEQQEQPAPQQTGPTQQPTQTEQTEPPKQEPLLHTEPYSLDELNKAIQSNTVDEARIPAQYQVQYQQYRQAQAQRRQQFEAQQQALQAQAQKQAVEQQRKMFADIDQAATKQAMQTVGLTQDDLDTAEYSDDDAVKAKVAQYRTAKEYFRGQLIGAIQQKQAQTAAAQNEQRAIYQSIVDFSKQKQVEEPHFAEINQLMGSYYQTMQYKDAAAVSDAIKALNAGTINPQQCKVLEGYYDKCRTAYYAKANDLTKAPKKVPVPQVEQPGTGAKSAPKPIDFTQMRNMTERERRAFLFKVSHSR